MDADDQDTRALLARMGAGDEDAVREVFAHIYDDLRELAGNMYRGNPNDRTLNPTALVHEAYARLLKNADAGYEGRLHFLKVATMAMRQLLTDYARRSKSQKRGGDAGKVTFDIGMEAAADGTSSLDLVALSDALDKLAELNERQARIAEMRFLVGMSVEETARALGVSPRTVKLDWQMARAWLSKVLGESE